MSPSSPPLHCTGKLKRDRRHSTPFLPAVVTCLQWRRELRSGTHFPGSQYLCTDTMSSSAQGMIQAFVIISFLRGAG